MELNDRLIIYDQIITPACTFLFILIDICSLASDGLSLLFSTPLGPMHPNFIRLGN